MFPPDTRLINRVQDSLFLISSLPPMPEEVGNWTQGNPWPRGFTPDLIALATQHQVDPEPCLMSLSTPQFRVDETEFLTLFGVSLYKGWCRCGGFFWVTREGLELRFDEGIGCMGNHCTVAKNPLHCVWWNPEAATRLLLSQALLDITEEDLDPEWLGAGYDDLVHGVMALVRQRQSFRGQHWPSLSFRNKNLVVGPPATKPAGLGSLQVQIEEGVGGGVTSIREVALSFQVSEEEVLRALTEVAPWEVPTRLGELHE